MKKRIDYLARSEEEALLLRHIADKVRALEEQHYLQIGPFLSPSERALVCRLMAYRDAPRIAWQGGYPEARRQLPVFLPDYLPDDFLDTTPEECPLAIVRCTPPRLEHPAHKDYLGALIGLGLSRRVLGDILVHETGADCIVKKEHASFIAEQFDRAGRIPIRCECITDLHLLHVPEESWTTEDVILSSLRLDTYVATVFRCGRNKAQSYITQGHVMLNDLPADKITRTVHPDDVVSLRRHGRTVFQDIVGKSRKENLIIRILRYPYR
ncbi:MAG: YlmH/Sll1252 family protein [Eubacteriales bacterium]|nr:YlmH/Sll1252 family protein [Eubacteriales bacterium]